MPNKAPAQPEVGVELVVAGDGKSYAKRFQTVTVNYTAFYVRMPLALPLARPNTISLTCPTPSLLVSLRCSWMQMTHRSSGTRLIAAEGHLHFA
jgi:hypothetical protein